MTISETRKGTFGLFNEKGECLFEGSTLAPVVAEFCRRWGLSAQSEQNILRHHQRRALSRATDGAYGKGHP